MSHPPTHSHTHTHTHTPYPHIPYPPTHTHHIHTCTSPHPLPHTHTRHIHTCTSPPPSPHTHSPTHTYLCCLLSESPRVPVCFVSHLITCHPPNLPRLCELLPGGRGLFTVRVKRITLSKSLIKSLLVKNKHTNVYTPGHSHHDL